MSTQYCFDLDFSGDIDVDAVKDHIRSLYVGKNKFKSVSELPFVVIYAKYDKSVCILPTSRAKANLEKINKINSGLASHTILGGSVTISKPYKFELEGQDWWEGEGVDPNKRWTSLIHNGPYFTHLIEPYRPLGASLGYKGKWYPLSAEEERVARFYGNRIISEQSGNVTDLWTKDPVFNKNFMTDFRRFLSPKHKAVFANIKDIDWSDLTEKILANKKTELTKEEKDQKLVYREEKKRNYGYAFLDKKREKVGNFTVEPMNIFYGRGKHPSRGRLKKEVMPEDVTINAGILDPKPKPPKGHKWGAVVNDRKSVWLAKWKAQDGKIKYVWFDKSGRFKGEGDLAKYEKARKLQKMIKKVRDTYSKDARGRDPVKKQLGTILYLIDNFGIRIGNEKGEDEADTVGATTLKVGNVNLDKEDHVVFDFLGKDSVRFYKDLEVPEYIYKNFQAFTKGKTDATQLFDKVGSKEVNAYLKQFDPELTAKIFRTRLASTMFADRIEGVKVPKGATKARSKTIFNKVAAQVAGALNHARTMSKKAKESLEKDKKKLKEKKAELRELKKAKKSTKRAETSIKTLKNRIESKSDLKEVAVNTSINNYIDPRLVVAWTKQQKIPAGNVYTADQLRTFDWAVQTTPADWKYSEGGITVTEPLVVPRIGPGTKEEYEILLALCEHLKEPITSKPNPILMKRAARDVSRATWKWFIQFPVYLQSQGVNLPVNMGMIKVYEDM